MAEVLASSAAPNREAHGRGEFWGAEKVSCDSHFNNRSKDANANKWLNLKV